MKKLYLFVLSMTFVVSVAFATGLPYVAAVLPDGTSVLMSYAAANAYRTDETVVKKLVTGTIQGKKVLMLPNEQVKTPVAKQDSVSNNLNQLDKAIKQASYCEGNADCEYLKILWKAKGSKDDQIPALINGARADFAGELRKQKKLCYRICDGAVKQVETSQLKHILGQNPSIKALDGYLFAQPEFTVAGWNNTLLYLCQLGQKNTALKNDIKKFAKKTEKQFDSKKLPIVTPSNIDPYAGTLGAGLSCIESRL